MTSNRKDFNSTMLLNYQSKQGAHLFYQPHLCCKAIRPRYIMFGRFISMDDSGLVMQPKTAHESRKMSPSSIILLRELALLVLPFLEPVPISHCAFIQVDTKMHDVFLAKFQKLKAQAGNLERDRQPHCEHGNGILGRSNALWEGFGIVPSLRAEISM